MRKLLEEINRIEQTDLISMRKMRDRLNNLTKPLGSLGELEEIAVRLAGIQGTVSPKVDKKAIVVMCGDHGVVEEGVSAYPQAVTGVVIDGVIAGTTALTAYRIEPRAREYMLASHLSVEPAHRWSVS